MKKTTRIISLAMALLMCLSMFVGCGGGGGSGDDGPGNVTVDTSKSQLYVYCFNAGYKIEWLNAAIVDYEAAVANKSFEEGKKGVQIIPYTPREWPTANAVKTDTTNEVWFIENVSYHNFVNEGIFADISSAFTTANPYETDSKYPTLESRLDEYAKETLNVNGSYYAIPWFHGSYNFIYNVELFDKYGWYFDTNGNIIGLGNAAKSAGPNGKTGDYDDGLPATYAQFFELCDKIASQNKVPVSWPGASYQMFIEYLLATLICDYEGYDTMLNSFNYTGEMLLAKIENGELVFDEDNKLVVDTATVTEALPAEVYKKPGVYYGLKFIDRLMNTDKYHNKDAFSVSYQMVDSQDDFILSGVDGVTTEIAMLLDGDWWMSEASVTFDDYADDYGSEFERNFRVLPTPKADESKIGEPATILEEGGGFGFVSANIAPEKLPIAIDFLQFLNSSEQLTQYTQITSTLRPLNYDITEGDLATFTPYAQSLVEYKLRGGAKMVRRIPTTPLYAQYEANLFIQDVFNASYNGTKYSVAEALHKKGDTGATPENYVVALYNYMKGVFGQD